MQFSLFGKSSDPTGNAYPVLYLLFALSGLSFLFFLGFPFGNHNESYGWIPILDNISFWNALTSRLGPVQSFRPLGTATAWLTYKISGSIYLQQLFNWLFACLSFGCLFNYAKNKAWFSIAAFFAAAGFFSGYIYLFHLHGVFYGPLQLYIAYLTGVAYHNKTIPTKRLIQLFIITLLAAFYHTFALLVFVAYLAGCILQIEKNKLRRQAPVYILFLLLSIGIMYLILSMYDSKTDDNLVQGTLTSFTTTELNKPLSFLAALFTLATIWTMTGFSKKIRFSFLAISILSSALFLYFHMPVLLLWIVACIIKMLRTKNIALAAIIAATAVFPVATHTGTPTYIIYVIMICAFVTSIYDAGPLRIPTWLPKCISVVIVILAALLFLLKTGTNVPIIAASLNPVLAEQEKTHQLETILKWKKGAAPFTAQQLRFFDESTNPANSGNAVNRKNRPPTQQRYMDRYLNNGKGAIIDTNTTFLLITFGGKKLENRHPVFKVAGRWTGAATVYE